MNNIKKTLTKEDVWGCYDNQSGKLFGGMIIARGIPASYGEVKCPVWGDVLPYKSVTIECAVEQWPEVEYWLDYVLGGGSVSKVRYTESSTMYARADYQCW